MQVLDFRPSGGEMSCNGCVGVTTLAFNNNNAITTGKEMTCYSPNECQILVRRSGEI